MKALLIICVLTLQSISFAMSKEDFLKLDDAEKEEFLYTKATELTDDKDIQLFVKNEKVMMSSVLAAGDDVSTVWYDTILEGPYSLVGELETRVETLYTFNGEVLAVVAVVASEAFNTDSCLYDEETEEWGDDCVRGSISETFVVDFEGNIIDLGYYAEFND